MSNFITLDEERLARLAGLSEGIGGSKARKKNGKWRKRAFTRNVDKQEASLNGLGVVLDKIDFLNWLDKGVGMPRIGFKKGHAVPFDKFDEPDIAKLTTDISKEYKEKGGSFENITDAEKDEIVDLLDSVAEGEQLAKETLARVIVRQVAKKQGINIEDLKKKYNIVGIANLDRDKRYAYGIVKDPDTDVINSFIAMTHNGKRIRDTKPYPIKPGSPLIYAAEALGDIAIDDSFNEAGTELRTKIESDLENFEKVTIDEKFGGEKEGLTKWAMTHYGNDVLDQLIAQAKKDGTERQVGTKRMNAAIYIADLVAYLNGLGDRSEYNPAVDGDELIVPKIAPAAANESTLAKAVLFRESYLSGRSSLLSLITESDWNSVFNAIKSAEPEKFAGFGDAPEAGDTNDPGQGGGENGAPDDDDPPSGESNQPSPPEGEGDKKKDDQALVNKHGDKIMDGRKFTFAANITSQIKVKYGIRKFGEFKSPIDGHEFLGDVDISQLKESISKIADDIFKGSEDDASAVSDKDLVLVTSRDGKTVAEIKSAISKDGVSFVENGGGSIKPKASLPTLAGLETVPFEFVTDQNKADPQARALLTIVKRTGGESKIFDLVITTSLESFAQGFEEGSFVEAASGGGGGGGSVPNDDAREDGLDPAEFPSDPRYLVRDFAVSERTIDGTAYPAILMKIAMGPGHPDIDGAAGPRPEPGLLGEDITYSGIPEDGEWADDKKGYFVLDGGAFVKDNDLTTSYDFTNNKKYKAFADIGIESFGISAELPGEGYGVNSFGIIWDINNPIPGLQACVKFGDAAVIDASLYNSIADDEWLLAIAYRKTQEGQNESKTLSSSFLVERWSRLAGL